MYLGIDLGTSAVKAMLIDDDQNIIASATDEMSVSRPETGWSEQDAGDWVRAVENALAALQKTRGGNLASLRGIGLSGQMHGATLLDSECSPLWPCLLWNDTRSHIEAAEMDADPAFRDTTGNIVFPGFTAPKVEWMRRHKPEIFDKIAMVLLPKDYVRYWLTGEFASDMSDSAGTGWFDTGRRDWSDALLNKSGLSREQMPRLVEGSETSGMLRAELAERYGITPGIPVAGGAGDNAAAACGLGTVAPGSAFVSLGTSGVLFAANGSYLPSPQSAVHTFCHALPETWHQMGVILSATDALNWYADIVGERADRLAGELGDTLRPPSEATFLPYLSGERTPHNDAKIRGAFAGLDRSSGRRDLTHAVIEGVAYALRDSLEALRQAGTELDRVTAVGGGSNSGYWLSVLATVLGIPVDQPRDGDFGAAFGAARLGMIAATKADPNDICTPPAIERTFEPNQALRQAYEDGYRRYRALYPAISGAMK